MTSSSVASLGSRAALSRNNPTTPAAIASACPTAATGPPRTTPIDPSPPAAPIARQTAPSKAASLPRYVSTIATAGTSRAAATTVTIVEVDARSISTKPVRKVPAIEPTAPQK